MAFELTDDGGLCSSTVESTGEAGKVVLGAATLGAAVGGVVLGLPRVVGGALATAAGVAAKHSVANLQETIQTNQHEDTVA